MTLLTGLTVLLVVATAGAAIFTGRQLAEVKKRVFQLEMVREALRRRLGEVRDRQLAVQGNLELLQSVKEEKLAAKAALAGELLVLEDEVLANHEVGVSSGLKVKSFDLAASAA